MRIITLWQPWASLMALNEKHIETRSWMTRYRGELAIHAAQRFDAYQRDLCGSVPFRTALERHGIKDPAELPLGAIVARTTLVDCGRISSAGFYFSSHGAEFEKEFGDYRPGRCVWVCDGTQACRDPIPYQGAQGIRELPIEIAELVRSMTADAGA